ncbi:MAG: hypothetical protein IJZ89_08150, partial [Clostridia bacterium]|nr:hypothetical protein [Clostridia bacterium]
RGTRGCEVAVPYGWATDLNDSLKKLALENNLAIASTIETYKDQIAANITATYDEYPALNHVEGE